MINFFSFLVHSNLYISLSASCLFFYYALKAKQDFFLSTPIMIFFSTWLSYSFLRIYPSFKLGKPPSQGYLLYKRQPIFFLIMSVLTIISMGIGVNQIGIKYETALAFLILTLYESTIGHFSLRQIPYLKTLLVGLVWSLALVGLLEKPELIHFIDCFVFIVLLTYAFDIQDQKQDRQEKIKTPATSCKHFPKILVSAFLLYGLFTYIFQADYSILLFSIIFIPFTLKRFSHLSFYLAIDGLILCRFLLYLLEY